MARLIDADALIEEMNKCARQNFTLDDNFEHWLKGMVSALEIIEEQPTAYDVDAVVTELKKESYQEFCDSPQIVELNDAIEIVKAGGKV